MSITREPSDVLSPDPDWYAWAAGGWENASEGSVRVAEHATRGQAAAYYARELGEDITGVRAWKRYVRPWTRRDAWEYSGADRARDDRIDALGLICKHDPARGEGLEAFWYEDENGREVPESEFEPPDEPPADWEPNEYDPVWEFVHRGHPDAIAVWVCGTKDDEPPPNPKPRPDTTGEDG